MSLRRILRTPLLWFLTLGAGLFVLDRMQLEHEREFVAISTGDMARLQAQWKSQMARSPTTAELDRLVSDLILERRLALEARALGLDLDDVIVQRRLAQKMRFLSEGLSDGLQPDRDELMTFFSEHAEDYVEAAELSFRHVFLSPTTSTTSGRHETAAIVARLREHTDLDWRALGDPYVLGHTFRNRRSTELEQNFGAAFVAQLMQSEQGVWLDPLDSDLGRHIVIVDHYAPPRSPALDDVYDQVLYDYRREMRAKAFARFQASLAGKYPVVMTVHTDGGVDETTSPSR